MLFFTFKTQKLFYPCQKAFKTLNSYSFYLFSYFKADIYQTDLKLEQLTTSDTEESLQFFKFLSKLWLQYSFLFFPLLGG